MAERIPIVGRNDEAEPIDLTAYVRQKPFSRFGALALGGIVLVSIFMNFYKLGQGGFGNSYYAAGVRSMLDNWRNFFFVSYDPGGFVSIDKPPVGFWLQVASSTLFGFTPFSVFLPQALAGVLAVILLYHLVRRHFGVTAGLFAALALAVSPISVVTNRNNTIDSTLALVLLLGAWAVLRAVETGRLRWLLLSAAIVGIGFNVKMLEAYLVVPSFVLVYLLAAPHGWWKRIGHLSLAGVLLVAISLSWVAAVDLTPAAQRPWVGSTQNNSELSLALGYNGIDRLIGMFGRRSPTASLASLPARLFGETTGGAATGGGNANPTFVERPGGVPNGLGNAVRPSAFAGGGMFGTGAPGPLRLFAQSMGGQIAWLLPAAILGIIAVAWQRRWRLRGDRQQQSLVLWGSWLLTMGVFFSIAGFIHQYYLTELAPAIAALFGIGIVTTWRDFRRGSWRGWLLPLALVATGAEQVVLLRAYPAWGRWLIPLIVGLGVVGLVGLGMTRLSARLSLSRWAKQIGAGAVSVAVLSLMVAPTVWAAIPVVQGQASQLPEAGPSQLRDFGGPRGGNVDASLISYLEANRGNATFLVAVPSSMSADSLILSTNQPVMALGGFMGSDPILTTNGLASLVKQGTVRFFLISAGRFGGPGGFGRGNQSAVTSWVTQNCKVVPSSAWQSAASNLGGRFGFGGANQLYDCGAK
ncbi:MAG TPA: glycosyltransferase family 39 protein [Chloroflexota bacterium]|nr:glycosyltransferase family 39 protein [Chloroflexota bacterium]